MTKPESFRVFVRLSIDLVNPGRLARFMRLMGYRI